MTAVSSSEAESYSLLLTDWDTKLFKPCDHSSEGVSYTSTCNSAFQSFCRVSM